MIAAETDYKPQFGLGAVYAGENSAMANQLNMQELIKAFLSNQRETSMQPLDIAKNQLEANRSTQLNTPAMLEAFVRGKQGEMQSAQAAGEYDTSVLPTRIDSTTSDNMLKAFGNKQNLDTRLAEEALATGVDQAGNRVSPEQQNVLSKLRENRMKFAVDSPDQRKAIAKDNATGDWHKDVARINAAGQVGAATKQAGAMEKANLQGLYTVYGNIQDNLGKLQANISKYSALVDDQAFWSEKLKTDPTGAKAFKTQLNNELEQMKVERQNLVGQRNELAKRLDMPVAGSIPTEKPTTQTMSEDEKKERAALMRVLQERGVATIKPSASNLPEN